MRVYDNKGICTSSYNREFHALAILKVGAFLPSSVFTVGSSRRLMRAPLVE